MGSTSSTNKDSSTDDNTIDINSTDDNEKVAQVQKKRKTFPSIPSMCKKIQIPATIIALGLGFGVSFGPKQIPIVDLSYTPINGIYFI